MKIQAIVTSVLLLALACPTTAMSATLKNFQADYIVKYDGIPFGRSNSTFTIHNHHYQLCLYDVTTVPFIKGKQIECSEGEAIKNKVIPEHYTYHYEHNGKQQNIDIRFNWQQHSAMINANHSPWKLSIPDGTQDKVSYYLFLQQLGHIKPYFQFPVADGGKIKKYEYKAIGQETISTPLGQIKTIKLERLPIPGKDNIMIWIAPDLNNMIVRVSHSRHIVDTGTAEIVDYHA